MSVMPSTTKERDQTAENLLSIGNLDDDNEEENLDDDNEEENLDDVKEEEILDDESEDDSFTTRQIFSFALQTARGRVTIITCCYM